MHTNKGDHIRTSAGRATIKMAMIPAVTIADDSPVANPLSLDPVHFPTIHIPTDHVNRGLLLWL